MSQKLVAWFEDVSRGDVGRVGGKDASLGGVVRGRGGARAGGAGGVAAAGGG